MGTPVDVGYDTARLPTAASAAETHARQVRDRTALAYLTHRGDLDIAAILGLLPAEQPQRRKPDGRPNYPPRRAGSRECPTCNQMFTPRAAEQRSCSRSCGNTYAARRRRGET